MSLEEFGQLVGAHHDAEVERSNAVAEVRERVALARQPRTTRAPRWALALAAAAILGVIVAVFVRLRPAPELTFSVAGEPASSGAWIAAADPSSITGVRFSDGSLFALHGAAHARVESVTADGAHVVLDRGTVAADVVHRPKSQWSVLAGPYEVRVTGTQFEVTWEAELGKLDVHVTRGSVHVSGGTLGARDLHMGESLTFEPPTAIVDEPPPPLAQVQASPSQSPLFPQHPAWRDLATRGRYADAMVMLEQAGVDATIAASGPPDLITMANAARLSGRSEIASKSLLSLRRRFPKDARAARGAFELGRLAFDQQHDYSAAATWFATSLSEDPSGQFNREAAGRLVEARQHAGDEAGARAAASDYLRRYPDGPHATLAKSLIRE